MLECASSFVTLGWVTICDFQLKRTENHNFTNNQYEPAWGILSLLDIWKHFKKLATLRVCFRLQFLLCNIKVEGFIQELFLVCGSDDKNNKNKSSLYLFIFLSIRSCKIGILTLSSCSSACFYTFYFWRRLENLIYCVRCEKDIGCYCHLLKFLRTKFFWEIIKFSISLTIGYRIYYFVIIIKIKSNIRIYEYIYYNLFNFW